MNENEIRQAQRDAAERTVTNGLIKKGLIAAPASIEPTVSAPDAVTHFNAQRLRNVIGLAGLSDPFPNSDEHLLDAMGAILGQVAGVLRAQLAARIEPPAQDPGELAAFEAWAISDAGGWQLCALNRAIHEGKVAYGDDDVHAQWEAWQARALYAAPVKPITLTVWCGAMPESNGKSNFTAILMRKCASLLAGLEDGMTIARSEYPDRVRYEADCFRNLIGEIPDKPFILDYDADKHSGYSAPIPPSTTPDGWISVKDRMPPAELIKFLVTGVAMYGGWLGVHMATLTDDDFYFEGAEFGGGCNPCITEQVTHWMPLPAAPIPPA